jgi:G:T/U-mismatch repair DNA glycosylase
MLQGLPPLINRQTRALGLPVYQLPSSSTANASWSFEKKLFAWREALAPHLGR